MPTRREQRPIEFQCQDCGNEFVASVPHLVHMTKPPCEEGERTTRGQGGA
jgi:hypothetical protein